MVQKSIIVWMLLGVLGVIAGAQYFEEIEVLDNLGKTHEEWLKYYLGLEHGIPFLFTM